MGATRWALAHGAWVFALVVGLSGLLLPGALGLESAVGVQGLLGPKHPALVRFRNFLEDFPGTVPLAAVYHCGKTARDSPCETVFDEEAVSMVYRVAQALARGDLKVPLESVATTPLVIDDVFGPELRRFVEFGDPVADRDALAAKALKDPLWRRSLVSPDGKTGAIVLLSSALDSESLAEVYAAMEAALAPEEERGWSFARVGMPAEFVVAPKELAAASRQMVPLMVLIVGFVLMLALGSVAIGLCCLASVGLCVVWTLGLQGLLGWPETSLSQVLAPLILVIGACDSLHFVTRLRARRKRNPSSALDDALTQTATEVWAPCLVTTVTTVFAFGAFATADLQGFRELGLLAAFGVALAWPATFFVLPLLLRLCLSRGLASGFSREGRFAAEKLGRHLSALGLRPALVLPLSALLLLVSVLGGRHLSFEASFEDLYGDASQVVTWNRFVAKHLRAPETLEVRLSHDTATTVGSADLSSLGRVELELAGQPLLGSPRSLVALAASAGLARPGGAEGSSLSLADLRRMQRLFPLQLQSWMRDDPLQFRLSLDAPKLAQGELRGLLVNLREGLAQVLEPGWSVELTGPLVLIHELIEALAATQRDSFLGATLAVALVAGLYFRSFAWGLLALVPAVLPVFVVLGLMGALGLALEPGRTMVAAVVVGIAVDDAVHFLSAYRRQRSGGRPVLESLSGAGDETGEAIVLTSLALAAGFFALLLSPWGSVASFGALAAVAILAALVACLVVLPALLLCAEFWLSRTGRGADL